MDSYIDWAAQQCISGEAAAMVTAPISKAAIRAAGIKFPGHTELLADRCGVDRVVMMLAGKSLKAQRNPRTTTSSTMIAAVFAATAK